MRVNNQSATGKKKPWQFMSKFVIFDAEGDPYLIRWRLISTPYGGVFLHKFLGGDSDPYVHDHPWSFLSVVLRGGYLEIRRDNKTRRLQKHNVKRFNLMRRDDAHYVWGLHRTPTWSLVFHGARRRTWGFWVPSDGFPTEEWIEFEKWEAYKAARGWDPRPAQEVR